VRGGVEDIHVISYTARGGDITYILCGRVMSVRTQTGGGRPAAPARARVPCPCRTRVPVSGVPVCPCAGGASLYSLLELQTEGGPADRGRPT